MMESTVILYKQFKDAHEMLEALAEVLRHESGVLDVETSDGDALTAFNIVEHTLTDGSKVRELVLIIE